MHYTLASLIDIIFYLVEILITKDTADFSGMTVWSIFWSIFKALVCNLKNFSTLTELLQYKSLWIISSILPNQKISFKQIQNPSLLLHWNTLEESQIVPVVHWLYQCLSYWFSTKNISMLCNCPGKQGWHRATPLLA